MDDQLWVSRVGVLSILRCPLATLGTVVRSKYSEPSVRWLPREAEREGRQTRNEIENTVRLVIFRF